MSVHRFFSSFVRLCTAALVVMLAAIALCGAAGMRTACLHSPGGGEAIDAARVSDQGEVVLSDGRVLRLVGVEPIDEAAVAAAIRGHVARGARLVAIADRPDRWGRYDAQIAVGADGSAVSLIEPLVAEGLALWRPDRILPPRTALRAPATGLSAACADRLAALEEGARRALRGGWGGDAPMPLDAGDIRRLKQYEGRFVVIMGQVLSVGERRAMTFVNFGRAWSRDFSVRIARADWEKMADEGVTAGTLEGRRVMVRGDLLPRDTVGALSSRSTGSAPAIRLSVARGIAILDSD